MIATLEQSNTFNTVKDFNKAYSELRDQVLIRHGYQPGAKVKLVNAVRLMMSFDGVSFVKCGTVKTDMIDRIKSYKGNDKVAFKLVAMV